ncbi:MAG: hypothetical protein Q8908_01780 [Bacteroidota bacterium]|nr:hypothetical protein [Bacteroidota bacterium]
MTENTSKLFTLFQDKSLLKQDVYHKTLSVFKQLGEIIRKTAAEYAEFSKQKGAPIPFQLKETSEFEMELHFGSDILMFMMHTNVFEFSRDHEVMKTPYIREDSSRSYCGVINIYNFLADSFKYNRVNDLGYLIGRVFINKEMHYFIEGKREIGFLYQNFATSEVNEASLRAIIESSIGYTVNFDLLTPPFDTVKVVSVFDIQTTSDNMKLRTGKRLGFKFQGDHDEIID